MRNHLFNRFLLLTALIGSLGWMPVLLEAQDLFEVRRLSTEPGREGFATWSPDGKQLIYQHTERGDAEGRNGLWLVNADGSKAIQILSGVAEHPRWSPDGRWVVFDADTGQNIQMIPVNFGEADGGEQGLTAGEPREFLPDSIGIFRGGLPCWSPDSRQIAFLEGSTGTLHVYHLEKRSLLSLYREEGILPFPGGWTPDGKFVLVGLMDRDSRKSTLWKYPVDGGNPEQILGHHENFYRHMALSPDGSLLVYAALEERHLGLFIMLAEGGASLPLTLTEGAHNEGAVWSPDGQSVAFNSTRGQNADIWIMEVDPERIKKELRKLEQNEE